MLIYILIWAAVVSLVTFILYGADKHFAKVRKRRIPEAVLLTLSLIGGGVGGLSAMLLFRHKTKHFYFYVANVLGIMLFAALAIFFK